MREINVIRQIHNKIMTDTKTTKDPLPRHELEMYQVDHLDLINEVCVLREAMRQIIKDCARAPIGTEEACLAVNILTAERALLRE